MGHPDRPALHLTALLLSVFPAQAPAQDRPAAAGDRLEAGTVRGQRQ